MCVAQDLEVHRFLLIVMNNFHSSSIAVLFLSFFFIILTPLKVLAKYVVSRVRIGTGRYCTVCWYGMVEYSAPWSTVIRYCMVVYCLFCALVGNGLNVFIGVRRCSVFLCLRVQSVELYLIDLTVAMVLLVDIYIIMY
jgi:hypothetical protein